VTVRLLRSDAARAEAQTLLDPRDHLHGPASGELLLKPTADAVLGCAYLTALLEGEQPGVPESARGSGMVFSSPLEVGLAYAAGKVGVHARVRVRLPYEKEVVREDRSPVGHVWGEWATRRLRGLIETTVGRVLFNDALPAALPFYDLSVSVRELNRIFNDCETRLEQRETAALIERVTRLGCRECTRAGLSLSVDDFRVPGNKGAVLAEAEKQVEKVQKQYDRGIICNMERHNQVIDRWTHARDQITRQMMHELQHDVRDGTPYLNPIFLMANSGARGGVEQIRQLAGMRGLMAWPSEELLETPVRANFREGLNVLEYFSSLPGARRGLLEAQRKEDDAETLTGKLVAAVQDAVITMHDCGTVAGVSKGYSFNGEEVERLLSEAIRGRVARGPLPGPASEVIVEANEPITAEAARAIEAEGIDKVRVRSPLTCEAPRGVCRLCYGADPTTGLLVEEGTAVGILASLAIPEPGRQLRTQTLYFGIWAPRIIDPGVKAKKAGTVRLENLEVVTNDRGERVALGRKGELHILGPKDRVFETHSVPHGTHLAVEDGQAVQFNQLLFRDDPHRIPILAETGGRVRFEAIVEGETLRKERDHFSGAERWVIMEHQGDLHPLIVIEDERGNKLEVHYIPEKVHLEVREGQQVLPGTLLAKRPREVVGTQNLTGGLPRITEIFEARRPRWPSVLAEVAGIVRLGAKRRGERPILIQPVDDQGRPTGAEVEHLTPSGQHARVQTGEYVEAGEALTLGQPDPHALLRILGPEAAQEHLLRELRAIYLRQRISVDDRHFEVVLAQMFRKAPAETAGDPAPARVPPRLLGLTEAARLSASLLQRVSRRGLGRWVARAARAGRTDDLQSLEANLLLRRPVPIGTGIAGRGRHR
jgi:DNA-directed RNA polymerase subunit beta'